MEYKIDATNKKIGRVATEAASILLGKNTPDFAKHKISGHKVVIENAGSLDISEKKKEEKTYKKYSGYPGGLKITPMNKVIEKKGVSEVLKTAITGMIPRNKLRKDTLKNLVIKE